MRNIDRLFSPSYQPNDEDILHSRKLTLGIEEICFAVGNNKFRVLNASGIRSQRKLWVREFEKVQCLVFVASLSGYDGCLVEDSTAVSLWFRIELH